MRWRNAAILCVFLMPAARAASDSALRAELLREVDGMKKQMQVMNDMIFSFEIGRAHV